MSLVKPPSEDIYVFGNSHIVLYKGNLLRNKDVPNMIKPGIPELNREHKFLHLWHMGSSLAYSLADKTHGARITFESWIKEVPKNCRLVLHFGEIDCRNHIVKQAHDNKESIIEVAKDCAIRYATFIDDLVSRGFDVGIIGPHPLFRLDVEQEDVMIDKNYQTGFYDEILIASGAFNDCLQELSEMGKFKFTTMFWWMLATRRNLDVDNYFPDYWHLSKDLYPMALNNVIEMYEKKEESDEENSQFDVD